MSTTWNEYKKELEARVEASTPGPWLETNIVEHDGTVDQMQVGTEEEIICSIEENIEENQSFIANARTDVPLLLECLERLTEMFGDRFTFWSELDAIVRKHKGGTP